MSTINLTLGTKNFLEQRMDKNSILAHNAQHPHDYLLIQTTFAENITWHSLPSDATLLLTHKFYAARLDLDQTNRALLINQAAALRPQSILYKRNDQQVLLILTSDQNILATVSQMLHVSVANLNSSLIEYLIV
ncbi:hypothetical protein [Bombilactobacillus thymidiniphilus]|uniref:Uncharacterized protein n=1 Tax=Bombilactobacillus thymidiniphilus TaxID=2923363 RepID=A0ABY4PCP1_9LACO|nr:hypothetical protein [Bombilactobacillus thymidiniphilus]UQS83271.1 hypothetical protein MOO47_05705 [Bombilactobacillus thymidiniphilus]